VSAAGNWDGAISIRPAAPADEASWRELWQYYCDFYAVAIGADVTDNLWLRIMDGHSPVHALVAEYAPSENALPELIGIANYVLHPFTWGTALACYLEDLFVTPHYRNRGAATALIGRLVDMAKANGWPRVYWHTHEDNEVARSLYGQITPCDPFVRYVVRISEAT
jgi:GNAT superfamily N-acetyltransferase